MSNPTIDADTISSHAAPDARQHAHEIQPYGRVVARPMALAESACAESVTSLNQILADTLMLRDLWFLSQHVVDVPLVRSTA